MLTEQERAEITKRDMDVMEPTILLGEIAYLLREILDRLDGRLPVTQPAAKKERKKRVYTKPRLTKVRAIVMAYFAKQESGHVGQIFKHAQDSGYEGTMGSMNGTLLKMAKGGSIKNIHRGVYARAN
jgi:hypothetical protein